MAEQRDPWEINAKGEMRPKQSLGGKVVEGVKHAGENFVGALGDIDNAVRVAARGATFGGADHLAAAAANATGIGGPGDVGGQQIATQEAKDALGPIAGNAAELGGAMLGPLSIPGQAMSTLGKATGVGMLSGIAGTTAQTYFDTGDLPSLPAIAVGGLLGAGGGAVGYGLGKLLQRPPLDHIQEKAVNLLNQEGIDVTAGQASGRMELLRREAGATGAADLVDRQQSAFSNAALRRAGIIDPTGAGKLDPTVLDDGFRIVGGQMDQLAANNPMVGQQAKPFLQTMLRDVADIGRDYAQGLEGSRAPIVQNTYNQILQAVKRGSLDGASYQQITSKLEEIARGNPNLAPTLRDMRRAIANQMEAYLQVANPADATLWQGANRRYSNLLVIQDAFTRAGRDAANGYITPQNLAAATKTIQGKRRYGRGTTDFDDLARAGISLLRPIPVGQHASPQEIAKLVGRKLTGAALGGGMAMQSGMSPMLAGATALGGYAAAEGLERGMGALALRPVASMSKNAASSGAILGNAVGTGLASENPFARATQK